MTTTLLLIIQIFIVVLLVAVILTQKTSADSIAGLSGGGNNIFSSRTTSNIFSKATVILALAFVCNSLLIAKVTNLNVVQKTSIVDKIKDDADKHHQNHEFNNDAKPKLPLDSE